MPRFFRKLNLKIHCEYWNLLEFLITYVQIPIFKKQSFQYDFITLIFTLFLNYRISLITNYDLYCTCTCTMYIFMVKFRIMRNNILNS